MIKRKNEEESYVVVKVSIDGKNSVGKTTLLEQYENYIFSFAYNPTIGIDFKQKELIQLNKRMNLRLFELGAGGCKFRQISSSYKTNSDICLFVYDITSRSSFEYVVVYLLGLLSNEQRSKSNLIALTGLKKDLKGERQIQKIEGRQIAESIGIQFFELSCKSQTEVDQMFNELFELYLQRI